MEMKEGTFIVTLTKRGQIKKTEVTEYENFREKGIIGVKIEDGDQLLSAALTDGNRDLIIATKQGMSIRFDEKQVRAMGRATVGVKGIDLSEGDQVVGLGVSSDGEPRVLAVCEKGYGKRTPLSEFRPQNRGGKGIILIDASDRNGPVVGIAMVNDDHEVMLVTDRGQTLRTKVSEIRETGRNAQGVRVMTVEEGERVVAIEALAESEDTAVAGTTDGGSVPPPPPEELN
jgi:DNA gyrase subunit A